MPKKTIYVKEEDLVLIEELKQMTGESFSSLIPKTFSLYHDLFNETNNTYTLLTIHAPKMVSFIGRVLVEEEDSVLYETRKKRLVLVTRTTFATYASLNDLPTNSLSEDAIKVAKQALYGDEIPFLDI